MSKRIRRAVALLLGLLSILCLAGTASADERDKKKRRDDDDGVSLGVLGGVGFPRPLAIEGFVHLDRRVLIGGEYSFLPTMTIASVDARLWAAAVDLRVFPFKGGFFVGMRAGHQHASVEGTIAAAGVGSYTEGVNVDTWFVNPRIGFLWVWKPFALGIDAGVQIPLSASVTRSTSSSVPAAAVDTRITSAADAFGRSILPTIDLLRVGLVL